MKDFEKLQVNDCWRAWIFKCFNKTNEKIRSNRDEAAIASTGSNKHVLGEMNCLDKSSTNWDLENYMWNKSSLQFNVMKHLVLLGTQEGKNSFALKEPSQQAFCQAVLDNRTKY